jgi:hypothetical protein
MPEKETRKLGLAAIEKARHQKSHAGGERQEHDEEYGRNGRREIGGEFAAKY